VRITDTSDVWWKNAVVYCLDVQTFYDGDGDGIGDFQGLAQRVDYLADLGVTCLWLMPFFPTADRDDGYDIVDFYGVDPRLGTLGDFVEFLRTARDRGLRVIVDLVVNHTSAEHPWFRAARSSPTSPFRDWYVWRDEPPEQESGVVFPDAENSVWTYDEEAGQYYLHHFYKEQPDLNVVNPAVRDEIAKILGFWMELGLSGFRVDAVPFLLETEGTQRGAELLPRPHDYLRDLRSFLERRRGDAILLGEVNLPYDQAAEFFGGSGDEVTMLFDFPGMQALYLSLAREDIGPLRASLTARPPEPQDGHWATFVRNHDELTLDKLSTPERQEVFDAFGPEEHMQLYGRGLRRRLPSMVGGDLRRLRLVYSLLFSLPGTPVLFYGEEIGMAENLEIPGRLAVRTPMQWDSGRLAGFSTVQDESALVRPLVEGEFAHDRGVNVADQRRDPGSLLNAIRRMAARYRDCAELGWGRTTLLDTPHAAVFAHRADWEGGTLLLVHHVADDTLRVSLTVDGAGDDCHLADLLDGRTTVPIGPDGKVDLELEPYDARWYRVVRPGDRHLV
jgi:trehalose synthase